MKRFIDLRGMETASRFAWYDTVNDRFEIHCGGATWDTWNEFAQDYEGDELDRYRNLAPNWTNHAEAVETFVASTTAGRS